MGVKWSPDGLRLAAGFFDSSVLVWDVRSAESHDAFPGHTGRVCSLAWSRDGITLASGAFDGTVRLWNTESRSITGILEPESGAIYAVDWSPDGTNLATASRDGVVRLWNASQQWYLQELRGHTNEVLSLAWSPDSRLFCSGSGDKTIRIWTAQDSKTIHVLRGHAGHVYAVAWSPDGTMIASGSGDATVQIYEPETGRQIAILEGHTGEVTSVSFSADGRFLATKGADHTVRLWDCRTFRTVAILAMKAPTNLSPIAFRPGDYGLMLQTPGDTTDTINLWAINAHELLHEDNVDDVVHYTNAKVVLVGDSGVGKSGLALRLVGNEFTATESTHGREIWKLEANDHTRKDGALEKRETLLWDLAGQPGYRLVHQLHLDEAALAVVIFDGRSEIEPFAGVRHWAQAIRQAEQTGTYGGRRIKKILVAARVDRGGISVSRDRIQVLVTEFGFEAYFETSAKEGWGINKLLESIREGIDWNTLPKVTSTELFQRTKAFLIDEVQRSSRVLCSVPDLYWEFQQFEGGADATEQEFRTCLGLLEARGIVQRLTFGEMVLFRPELLDSYASAIINAARDEPDGLGSMAEEDILQARFPIPSHDRLSNRDEETLLLIATVEELVRHELASREPANDGVFLVFPSHLTRTAPPAPEQTGGIVIFQYEGAALSIYATLAVRLSHSGLFTRKEMWRNTVTYTACAGGTCGLTLAEEEGRGDLTLFFDGAASEETRFAFESYVSAHLERRAVRGSITRRRMFACTVCDTPISELQANRRRERGFAEISCNVCGASVSLLDGAERIPVSTSVQSIDRAADARLQRDTAAAMLKGKIATADFDVLLLYNNEDRTAVRHVAESLAERGIHAWFDEWQLVPGRSWQEQLEEHAAKIKCVAVFVSAGGVGPWQEQELRSLLRDFARKHIPIIPVLLGGQSPTRSPVFLRELVPVGLDSSLATGPLARAIQEARTRQ